MQVTPATTATYQSIIQKHRTVTDQHFKKQKTLAERKL